MAETKTSDEKLLALVTKFKKERAEVSLEIKGIIETMSSFKGLKEVQIKMLSMRQRLLETNHTIISTVTTLRKKMRAERARQMEFVSTKVQNRYQANEKNVLIDGAVTDLKEKIDILENQIQFYADTIKTADNVLYGVKTRVEIEKTLGI